MRNWLLLILICMSVVACSKSDETAKPSIYLIPEGYKGWVMVEYDKEEGTPTEKEGEYTVFSINNQGKAKTKTLLTHEGWATNKYYYVTESGNRKQLKAGEMIHGASEGNENKNYTMEFFFVGTEEEFAQAGDYRKQYGR
ncbi:DUF6843 domain-containing protein [Metabacillus iocasae]|uniref:DUF6843 domain-containing protein n=1 Tax=Priestia iocasae TaxID=2291674 RepID=A0ABS2QX79_9BACI|nr:hypothetical protein [Metabacillus iocasae]MBM7703868.1 hypothetical protein [Metabacillus iocasae]